MLVSFTGFQHVTQKETAVLSRLRALVQPAPGAHLCEILRTVHNPWPCKYQLPPRRCCKLTNPTLRPAPQQGKQVHPIPYSIRYCVEIILYPLQCSKMLFQTRLEQKPKTYMKFSCFNQYRKEKTLYSENQRSGIYFQSPDWIRVRRGMIKGQIFLFHVHCSHTERVSPCLLCKTKVTWGQVKLLPLYGQERGEKTQGRH